VPSLSHTQWQQLSALLSEVLELPETERDAWLEALQARDPQVASLVAQSLDARAGAGFPAFLSGSAAVAAEMLATATLTSVRSAPM
jgi:hypothetical protein